MSQASVHSCGPVAGLVEHVLKCRLAPVVLLQQRYFFGKDLGPSLTGGVRAHHGLHGPPPAAMRCGHLVPQRCRLVHVEACHPRKAQSYLHSTAHSCEIPRRHKEASATNHWRIAHMSL